MRDILDLIGRSPDGSLTIRTDGPPNYRGEAPHRILVEGTPEAFRWFSEILKGMADAIEERPEAGAAGWSLVMDPKEVGPLVMEAGHLLSLSCEPSASADSSQGDP